MTISTTRTKVSYIPDGLETRFPVPFPFFDSKDVRCIIRDVRGNEQEITGFALEGMGTAGGAHVRFFMPPPAQRVLVIHRATRRVQESDYPEGGKFPAIVVEQDLDRITGMIQEIDEGLSRAVTVAITDEKTPEELKNELLRAAEEAAYYARLAKDAALQAGEVVSNSPVKATGSSEIRRLGDRFADVANVKDFGAAGDGMQDDSVAIQAACDTGKSVFLPQGRYRVSKMIYLTGYGQRFYGAGVEQSVLFNDINDEPLFLPGNPAAADQVAEFGAIEDISLTGNASGATLWGCFIPCAPYITDTAHPSAVYEGWMPSSADNYYHGKLSFATQDWARPARGFCMRNVRVQHVHGGYGVHASAWCWSLDDLQIYSCKRGIRISGACNSCNTKNLYINGTDEEGILLPDVPNSIPTNLMLINTVVQDCGTSGTGKASIQILKGTAVVVDGLFTERNNLKNAVRDVFVGVNAINTRLDNVHATVGNDGPYPGWAVVENQGAGTVIGSIFQRDVVGAFLVISGADSRTRTVLDNSRFAWLRGEPGQYIDNAYTGAGDGALTGSLYARHHADRFISLHNDKQGIFALPDRLIWRNAVSTANRTEIHTLGDLNFCTQVNDLDTTAGRINFFTRGDSDTGELLLSLLNSNGALLPGKDNASTLGSANYRWSQVYAGAGSINTSDARDKRDIAEPDEALLRAWGKTRFKTFRFIQALEEKGDEARIHAGLIAQDIQEAFASEGLDCARYGVFCFDGWPARPAIVEKHTVLVEPEIHDEDGNLVREAVFEEKEVEVAPPVEQGELYGIRYNEALALEAAYQRWRLDRLEARVSALGKNIVAR